VPDHFRNKRQKLFLKENHADIMNVRDHVLKCFLKTPIEKNCFRYFFSCLILNGHMRSILVILRAIYTYRQHCLSLPSDMAIEIFFKLPDIRISGSLKNISNVCFEVRVVRWAGL